MRIGSLFSGYGGLDLAVQSVLGGEVAWHVEYDKAPSRILDHHFPGVPNYGDVTKLDFTTVEPVDVLTGGYPCQPFSHAGLRKGTDDDRHLWPHVLRAICEMGPRLAILENVRGHLSLGFDTVLSDLASVGWSARWGVVRASDAGACHQRARLFIVAYPSHLGLQWGRRSRVRWAGPADGDHDAADACYCQQQIDQGHDRIHRERSAVGRGPVLTTRARGNGVHSVGALAGSHAARGSAAACNCGPVADADLTGSQARRVEPSRAGGQPSAGQRQPMGRDAKTGRGFDLAHSNVAGLEGRESAWGRDLSSWGDYGPAIARWERVTGRPAPAPTEPGRTGAPRLSPAFVEWMMGLPPGWVTDPSIGISRNDQLKALGNGVVPQQAALALGHLLPA